MRLLSDDEVAKVSTAENASALAVGDEYIDLEHLDEGVRKAGGGDVRAGNVIPKRAVHDATWAKLLAQIQPASTLRDRT